MIYQLHKEHYAIAKPLLAGAWIDLAALESVLDGQRAGQVFVDSLVTPTCAMIAVHYGNYFLLGNPTPEFERLLADAPAELGVFANPFFHIFPQSDGWAVTVARLAPDHVQRTERRCFRLDDCTQTPLHGQWRKHVPEGIAVTPLTPDLAERMDKDLSEQFSGPVWDEWTGYDYGERYPRAAYENLVAKSVGHVALDGETVVGCAWASSISDHYACVEVETAEGYQGKGLATVLCTALLEDFARRGLASEWIADADNTASCKLALRLGHAEIKPITKYTWRDHGDDFQPSHDLYSRRQFPQGYLWVRKAT